ncbi:hypothetical protein EYE40_05785 [Glaciihabitans arcticus]|uniref:Uncharacterized protein n=1 Tax=Glaciihabitans arcticus TaxID=2668039 RepID=A0A4Q9GTJ3_9MICO|nr:hypothetical protein [Glaciihabitans arcticus]TBN56948.1 hypothetical protein EYE40_05785 [Glaciihabitans arcticus]
MTRPLMSRFRDLFYGRDAEVQNTTASALSNLGQIEMFGVVIEKPIFESTQREEFEPDDFLPAEKPWELRD